MPTPDDFSGFRKDYFELVGVADTDNLSKASTTGNVRVQAVTGRGLYLTDKDGNSSPAVGGGAPVAAGATKSLTTEANANSIVVLDTLAGSTVTLPPATGSGISILCIVTVIPTSNSHIVKVADATDTMIGIVEVLTDNSAAVIAFKASGTDDTVTLNRSTTGGTILGEWLLFTDIAANLWHVRGSIAATGTEATPFSATVS